MNVILCSNCLHKSLHSSHVLSSLFQMPSLFLLCMTSYSLHTVSCKLHQSIWRVQLCVSTKGIVVAMLVVVLKLPLYRMVVGSVLVICSVGGVGGSTILKNLPFYNHFNVHQGIDQ